MSWLRPSRSCVLAASPLPGLVQTAFRAEVRAVLESLRIARALRRTVRIWCDCQGVVDRVCKLLRGQVKVRPNGRHTDLWNEISELLCELGPARVVITKVAAHQEQSASVSAIESWCFLHNGLADSAAQFANMQRSPAFWKLHDRFMRQTQQEERKAHHIQQALLQISRAVVFQKVAGEGIEQDMDPEPAMSQPNMPSPNPWPGIPEVAGCPAALAHKFGHRVVTSLCNWFFQMFDNQFESQTQWVSFYQLMQGTGDSGPLHLDNWEGPLTRPNFSLLNVCAGLGHLVPNTVYSTGQLHAPPPYVVPVVPTCHRKP